MSCEFGKLSTVKMSALACAHSLRWFTCIPLFLTQVIPYLFFLITYAILLYDLSLMFFISFISRLTRITQGKVKGHCFHGPNGATTAKTTELHDAAS